LTEAAPSPDFPIVPAVGEPARELSLLPALPATSTLPVTPEFVRQLEAELAERVALVDDLESLETWRAQAAALEAYFRDKELKAPMAGAQRRVEARIGQLLGEAEVGSHHSVTTEGRKVHKSDRHDFRILAKGFDALSAEEWRKSRRKLVSLLRDRLGLIPPVQQPGFPDGPFRTIVIDPPWPIEKIEFDRRPVEAMAMDYRMMSLKEIGELPVAKLANAEGAHVYLWVTHRFLPEGLKLFEKWGVRYECVLTWNKPTAQPLWWRFLTEHVLFGKVGALAPMKKGEAVSFSAPQQRHSHKPDEFFSLVRRVSPGPRLTMFDGAREEFESWGHVHA